MGEFSNFKDYLIKFEYPNIKLMNNDQIDEIFSAQNRQFLCKWLMKHINSQFAILFSSTVTQTFLGDFLSQCGFCLPSKKLDFVQKSNSLSKTEEIEIFQRIFEFLQNSQDSNEKTESSVHTLELEAFLKKDLNLFPGIGDIKLRSLDQRKKRVEYLNSEINNLKQKLGNYTEANLNFDNCCLWSPEETKTRLDNFRSNILKLRQVRSNVSCADNSDTFIVDSKVKEELGDYLAICSSQTNEAVKYFGNIKETQTTEFKKSECKSLEQDEVFQLCRQLADMSTKIIESK